MARNSLSDFEVSIIKALLTDGRRSNQEIVGLINRSRGDASSDINSGRISNIKKGTSKKYSEIGDASQAVVDQFMDAFERGDEEGPLSKASLDRLLARNDKGALVLSETERIECKKSFSLKFQDYIKTIAGFANNRGGYLLFGIEDATWAVLGLNEKALVKFNFDAKKFNETCHGFFRREVLFRKAVHLIDGKPIGIIYIEEATQKPLILCKPGNNMGEGQIYYRYPGESRLIGFVELEFLLKRRVDEISENELSKRIAKILRFGVENSAVVNLTTGELSSSKGNIVVDASTLEDVHFVKEGEFQEKSGAPTLKLIGTATIGSTEVKTINDDKYRFRPTDVINEVSAKSDRHFSTRTHENAWKMYKVRPKTNAVRKARTNADYCVFHPTSQMYTYSQEWIDFLVAEISDDGQYEKLMAFHRK